MKIKKCQIDFTKSCVDRGYACLKSAEEKREFNRKIEIMQNELEKLKFPDPQKIND